MTTAQNLNRYPLPWPYELRAGVVVRIAEADAHRRRLAARIARALDPAARTVPAWVSAEALVRVERSPDTALRPAVAVVRGDLPCDGVVDEGLLVVVELDHHRFEVWRDAGVGTVWLPQDRNVVVAAGDTTSLVEAGGRLRLPGSGTASIAAADICRLVAVSG